MPELPDLTIYVDALAARVTGRMLHRVRISSPFLLRTFDPPVDACTGHSVTQVHRQGKRIILSLDNDIHLAFHLMIAGRFLWSDPALPPSKPLGKIDLARLDFDTGSLTLTEAGTQKRASLHILAGPAALDALDAGGLDPLTCTLPNFHLALTRANRTLKRALTDPRTIAAVGNAYSDEILHAARLSPFKQTQSLSDDDIRCLYESIQSVLNRWIATLRSEFGSRFPGVGSITAFRPDFAVHGRFRQPCPVCQTPVQRITYTEKNDLNYCPTCQTGGRILADRALSRLLRADWPRTVANLDE